MKTSILRNFSIALVASASLFIGGCATGSKGSCRAANSCPATKGAMTQKCQSASKACKTSCPAGQQCPMTKKAACPTR